jgi:D-glycero-beta-D-manno-heptose 1-phosphate adenylyltransferase
LTKIEGGAALGPLSFDEAAWLGKRLPRPLVFIHRVFDVLHAGHVDCLDAARRLGQSLVVGLHTDASARKLNKDIGKDVDLPLHSKAQRGRVLAALRQVSVVVLFDENTPLKLIEALRPEVYVKGGGHAPADLQEAALVTHWGGSSVIVPRSCGLSTAGLLDRIRGAPESGERGSLAGIAA